MDRLVFAERAASVERHLRRVRDRLPEHAEDLHPMTDATDAVVLHLWQAVQIVIDIATSVCVKRGLGVPATYGDAFLALASEGILPSELASRLAKAAGFRNLVVHAYAEIDLTRVHDAALNGPQDLREFLRSIRDTRV
ncbi:type VII toxin-antitoxin system HepT family RNase toxin [Hoyosella altamirensis]|uniref:Uncharacterized protein YutE (UPF0331/DUF86 family) n=2 Tax=Hoyosella altamirensis TaxID=616997 RepID=A0A839RKB9_9ACTN|nr:DUF86 domain-containing protein [Hoyosella altamirensis]MBB3036566.1 uncharacterized protein YutE (UPF0331/DUF86 family) [Hoyosella altamirensis]